DGFVGGDDQKHKVHAAYAREHVADETLMAGDVDETEAQLGFISAAPLHTIGSVELQVREAKIDCDPAALFLFQTVGINAGQRFDQRGLAMIDVTGRADDDGLHCSCRCAPNRSRASTTEQPSASVSRRLGALVGLAAASVKDTFTVAQSSTFGHATIKSVPMSTTQVTAITPEVIADHGITPEEYERIKKALGREPSLTELGIFSVMWSEHCSYKSSRVHLKRLPTRSKLVLQGPGENAGIIDIGDGWACAFKIESHNHPSFIEPFQGAATGVGGILRDIFTMGARPLAVMDSLRFGPIKTTPDFSGPSGTGKNKGADQATIHKNH